MNRSILKISIVALLIVLGFSFNAQSQTYVLSTASGETEDSVTVGSRAGYLIAPDPTIEALSSIMNPSIFNWAFSNAAPILKSDGTATAPVGGFYSDTAISAIMPAAPTSLNLTVLERSQPKAGTGCDGNTQTLVVRVLPRATITFTGSSNGACTAQDYNVPVNLSGFGPWIIEYSITYTTFAGVSSAPVNYTIANNGADTVGTLHQTAASLTFLVKQTELASGLGTYAVNILNVYDHFAMKSLDISLVASKPTDLPAAAFDILVYPTPVTSPIQHVKNL